MRLGPKWNRTPAAGFLRPQRCVFVDIGARGGLPAHWADAGRFLDVVAFDADEAEARTLSAAIGRTGATAEVLPHAVWDVAGTKSLNVTRSPGCSSLYPPRQPFLSQFPDARRFDVVARTDVATVPLDDVMRDPVARPFRFVKIDAQGGALRILSGAPAVLDVALGLEIEVEFAEMYDGEPLFGAVDELLRTKGFELVDLRPTYWRRLAARRVGGTRGQLVFADALYMLAPGRFAQRAAALSGAPATHLAACACLIAAVYGLDDWAAAYAAALDRDLEPRRVLAAQAAGGRPFSWSWLPLRYPLGLWLKDLGDRLLESPDAWAVAEQRLGGKARFDLTRRLSRRLRR